MVLSQLCSKVILDVSFLDKHDGSSFCRLREGARLERSMQSWRREKAGLDLSIRSSVIGRFNVVQAGYLAKCDGLCVAKDNGAMLRPLVPATWSQCRGDRSKWLFSIFATLPRRSLAVIRESRCALESGRHNIGDRSIRMLYKKINVELIVVADEADAVVVQLNAALDRLEEKHTLFGGGIETVAFEHSGTGKRSALAHTIAAGETVAGAMRAARKSVNVALRAVI
jgi:hypothetical protein